MKQPNIIDGFSEEYEFQIRMLGKELLSEFYFDGTRHFIRVAKLDTVLDIIPKFNGEFYTPIFLYDDEVVVSVFTSGSFKFDTFSPEDVMTGKCVVNLSYVNGLFEVELVEDVS